MFDQFKAMGALSGLLRDQDRLREIGEDLKRRLEEIRVEGRAGQGAVRATASGDMRVVDVSFQPAMLASGETDGKNEAEALIAEAVNDALRQAREAAQREVAHVARELGLPDVPGLERLLAP